MQQKFNYSAEHLKEILTQIENILRSGTTLSTEKFYSILKKYPFRKNVISMEDFRAKLQQTMPEKYNFWATMTPRFEMTKVPYRTHNQLINAILDKMVKIVMQNYADPFIHVAAKIILGASNKSTEQNDLKEIYTILAFLRDNIRYTRDMLNIETLIQPQVALVKHASMDCDDFAMLAASLLMTTGYKVRFKAIQAKGAKQIHHVYVEVFSPQQNKWIPVDGILKRKPLNAEPPYIKKIIREIK